MNNQPTSKELVYVLNTNLENKDNETKHNLSKLKKGAMVGENVFRVLGYEEKEISELKEKGKIKEFSNSEDLKDEKGNYRYYHEENVKELIRQNEKTLDKIQEKDFYSIQKEVIQKLSENKKNEATELVVKHFEKVHSIYTTRDDLKSEMWIYKEGIYVPQGKTYVTEFCRDILEKLYTTYFANQVIAKIEADTYIDQETFFHEENKEEIPVKNGILNLRTKELKDFDSKKIFFSKLPMPYDPNQKCEKVDEFLSDVLNNSDDKKVFYELAGFGLYKEYFIEKAFMLVGEGRNGKGKTIELLKRMVGIENCAGVSLRNMDEGNFRISQLFGQNFNLAGDLNPTDLKETGIFKELTGRDQVEAPRKFLRPIRFTNYAKMVFSCNKLPRVYDSSPGFWKRWILLQFPYVFVEKSEYEATPEKDRKNLKIKDNHIIDKITTEEELSGLLNEALKGLDRLFKNEKFSYTRGTEEVKRTWIRNSDSFQAYAMDYLEADPNSKISKQKLRREYNKYCKKHKVMGSSDKSIRINLQEMFGVVDEYTTVNHNNELNNRQEWCWVGVKFKEFEKDNIKRKIKKKIQSTDEEINIEKLNEEFGKEADKVVSDLLFEGVCSNTRNGFVKRL